jgi:hypothetical protein
MIRKFFLSAFLLAFSSVFVFGGETANLLVGDADVELEAENMSNGAFSNSFRSNPFWVHDTSDGWQSQKSIRITRRGVGMGVHPVLLKPGVYTFSFWAKADQPGNTGYITVNPVTSSWPVVLKQRAAGAFPLTTEWKRYSYTFTAEGSSPYSGYYGNAQEGVLFDRFMLNAGDKPAEWVPTTKYAITMELPGVPGNVYEFDKPLPVNIRVSCNVAEKPRGELEVKVKDHLQAILAEERVKLDFGNRDFFEYCITLPAGRSGWFRIDAEIPGVTKNFTTVVMARPPEPTIKEVEPFLGLCGAQNYLQASRRIGIKWLQKYLSWYEIEEVPGKLSFRTFEEFKRYKEDGFLLQALITSGPPGWALPPETRAAIDKLGINYIRCVAPIEVQEKHYRPLMRRFMEECKGLFDIYELGGELDALIGLNTYYKSLDTKNLIGPFVAGESMEQTCHMMEIAAQEILRVEPEARISSVRPSDVDSRYAYAYSREVFKRLGKYMTCFGIDCYPQPRWIGPGQPPTGLEQDLAIRHRDSIAAMKGLVKGSDVMISEYGYFIDYQETDNPKYIAEHTNRIARSFLKAKLVGMKSLHWYTTESTGLEGKRYLMGIWQQGRPLPAVAALNTVGRVVENVDKCAEVQISEKLGTGVFGKVDGRAVAAVWSLRPEFTPEVSLPDLGFEVTDIMGNPAKSSVKNGMIRLKTSEFPLYVWLTKNEPDNYKNLHSAFQQMKVHEDIPAEIIFRAGGKSILKAYVKNTSSKNSNACFVSYECDGKTGRTDKTVIAPSETSVIVLPLPPSGEKVSLTFSFDGDYEPWKTEYTTPEIIRVPQLDGLQLDGSLDTWKVKPLVIGGKDHIHPVDHTTYTGEDDLSAKLYFAHDGTHFLLAAEVTDDYHFNNFSPDRIWKGDCLQIGIDPQTNFIRNVNDLDPDDSFFSAGLQKDGPALEVHRAPFRSMLKTATEYKVTRDEKSKKTLYQLKIPLQHLDPDLSQGSIFGFNCVVMDDDSGAGADYWLFLRQGLAGGLRPDKFALCILE